MKFVKYFSIAALALLSLSACSDILDVENKSTGGEDGDSYLTSNPEAALPVAYNAFRSLATEIDMHDLATDLYASWRSSNDGDLALFQVTADDSDVESYWTNVYSAINYANMVVHYNGSDTKYGAQGRFLRDYGYYLLTQQFGAVPYITKYIQSSERSYPKTDLEEIYDALIEDLTDLYNNSDLDATNHSGYASKQAVAALAAKVVLSKAWDIDTKLTSAEKGLYTVNSTSNFALAAEWAEKAINGVSLTMSFEDKWSPDNEGNDEEIWSIQYDRDNYPSDVTSGGHSLMNNYTGYYGNCVTVGQKPTSGGGNMQSKKAMYLWEKGDTRWEGTFMTTCYNAPVTDGVAGWTTEGYLAYFNCTAAELASKLIAFRFYPPSWTEEEVEADLATLTSQTVKPSVTGAYGVNNPFAVLLDESSVTKYVFNEDGSYTKGNQDFDVYSNLAEANGTGVKKFDDKNSSQVTSKNDYRDIPVFHVSDMYLIAAEAYLLAGQESAALTKLNAVRNRAGLSSLSSFSAYEPLYTVSSSYDETNAKLDCVLDERARELYAERTRYHDLRRTKQFIKYNIHFNRNISDASDMLGTDGEYKWYRPIPQTEFDTNIGMTAADDQNPGYRSSASQE